MSSQVFDSPAEEQCWMELAKLFGNSSNLAGLLSDDSGDEDDYPYDLATPPPSCSPTPSSSGVSPLDVLSPSDDELMPTLTRGGDCALQADLDDYAVLALGASSLGYNLPAPEGPASAAAAVAPKRRGGRKKGSKLQCDEALIMRLLPMSTKLFNQEIKTLRICKEEVKKLKFARRRIKNARAAHKRRCKISDNITTLQQEVEALARENQDLKRRLKASLEENALLKQR